jgi:riboflavin kinase/FMN adenylyltransferase
MRHFSSLEGVYLQDTWLTIGTFDGVHRGHQEIVRRLAAGAQTAGCQAVVLTFYPHPAVVLGKRTAPFYLTTPDERAALLGDCGADVVVTYPFDTRVAATSAFDFMSGLKSHLGLRHLLVGRDFALGKDREGNVDRLAEIGEQLDYRVEIMPPVEVDGMLVSSSRVRAALATGDMDMAASLLGRPYQVNGLVVAGDGRGRTIGIPTANLNMWAERAFPKSGVYICRALLEGRAWGAVANVGVRPTFEQGTDTPRVEAHLLDFEQDLYGQTLHLDFLARLRDEQRFPGIQALVEQIQRDIAQARQYFQEHPVG